jgi:hypothetical protein
MTEEYQQEDPHYFMDEIYKQWHKRGFLSVRYWPYAEKVQIEIGSIDPNTSKQISVSKCFIDAYKFLTYIHSETYGNVLHVFPDLATKDWQVFGGKVTSEGPVSRVFTAGYWKANKDAAPDASKRSFRCANYVGIPGKNGEMAPDYSKVISFNFIQMKFDQIAELYHKLSISMISYSAQKTDQVDIYDG